MAIDKFVANAEAAIADIHDGAVVMVGGFGDAGSPTELLHALADRKLRDLTVINNNAGTGEVGLARLLQVGSVSKVICSFPRSIMPEIFEAGYRSGQIKLETVPQGTLAERIRVAGAGIGAFYTPTSVGTMLAEGKEVRTIEGVDMVLEYPLRADFTLIKADQADRWGNLTYRKAARNFSPLMAMAGRVTIVQALGRAELGEINPETIVTPGIFVDRVIVVENPLNESIINDELLAQRQAAKAAQEKSA